MNKVEKSLLAVIGILLFQITRNINLYVYISILMVAYVILYWNYFMSLKVKNKKIGIPYKKLLFLITLLQIPIVSLLSLSFSDYISALSRYLVTLPFIIFCCVYDEYNKILVRKILRAYVFFMVIASLSIPYQILFGKISFLAESSTRVGLERFSSLAGSLTAIGTLGAFAFAILLFNEGNLFSSKTRIIFLFFMLLGMLTSLQKAAIANIVGILLIYIFKNKFNFLKIIFLVAVLLSIYFLFEDSLVVEYIKSFLQMFEGNQENLIKDDLIVRLTRYPLESLEFNNITLVDSILGKGFKILGGTLGLSKFPMAHNNYFDIGFSGGIFHLYSYLFLISNIMKLKNKHIFAGTYRVIGILILVNMLIGAAPFYQPVFCVLVFIVICSNDCLNKKGGR